MVQLPQLSQIHNRGRVVCHKKLDKFCTPWPLTRGLFGAELTVGWMDIYIYEWRLYIECITKRFQVSLSHSVFQVIEVKR